MKDVIGYEEFAGLDLRVGEVVECVAPEWSRKLLEMRVSFGEEVGEKTVMAAVREWYEPRDLIGVKGVFVVNLEPKKMGEGLSEGMMLMVDGNEKPVPIEVGKSLENGTVVR